MGSPVEEIKSRIDAVDFIRQYLELSPAGKNYKASCPFHNEKTPSFMVSPERQSWHCFGCGEGGDIFTFLMKYENIEFSEALKVLAEKAGVELKRLSPADQRQFGVLYEINEAAKNFFKKQLSLSSRFSSYLKERGIKPETAEEFELGASGGGWEDLTLYLVNSGFDINDIARAGLAIKSESRGTYFDRFRNRLIFPIYNHFGKVVGFSGRILPEFEEDERAGGKYVNSPETPIFSKSRLLYGFHKSKNKIREAKSVLLVEGQMDFLMAWQDGVRNAAAVSGTALTRDHLKILGRMAKRIILSFDNDEAGMIAGERAIDLIGQEDLEAKVLLIKKAKDVAEIVEREPGKLARMCQEAAPAMEFYFDRYLNFGGSGEDGGRSGDVSFLKQGSRVILTKIKNLASIIEQNYWIKELSKKSGIGESALLEEMAILAERDSLKKDGGYKKEEAADKESVSRRDLIAQKLISLAIFKNNLGGIQDSVFYFTEPYKKVFSVIEKKEEVFDERVKGLIDLVYLRSGLERDESLEELKKQLKIEFLKARMQELGLLIKKREREGDEKNYLLNVS